MADEQAQAPEVANAASVAPTSATITNEGTPAPSEGVMTPMSRDEDPKSRKVTLADLSAKATTLYAHRQYEEAAEVFSRASVLQAELNGETAPENADILFHYGRCLFKVGQSKSDVLGGPAAADKSTAKTNSTGAPKPKPKPEEKTEAQKVTQEGVAIAAEGDKPKEGGPEEKKPLFQFTGDENFDESSDEEQEDEAPEEEDDDDLAVAFEILDLARVCYEKQLAAASTEDEDGKGKGKAEDSSTVRHIKERLADTHDCLSEISLENERYPNAIEDGRISLTYKLELYPDDSEIIAEAHYKLSLAYEFASVTTAAEDGANAKRESMDQELRDKAIEHMELAIKSSKLKLKSKEDDVSSPSDRDLMREAISEMKEVIADMGQRLVDLRKDPVDAQELLGGPEANALGGIFGATLGESAAETQARVQEATKTATDLTGLVRKKKAAPETGKRKAEDEGGESVKKAKVEE